MKNKDKVKNGGVVIIPKNTLRCNTWLELKPTTKLVFIAMMTEWYRGKDKNPDNKVKISQVEIKYLTGMSRTSVWRSIKELKETKFVSIAEEDQGGLEKNVSKYTLNGRYLF